MPKRRADQLLVDRGLCATRGEAQRVILSGKARLGPDDLVRKAGQMLPLDAELSVDEPYPYVGRGAEKLLAAVERFAPPLDGAVALDIGASTGGFTDLLLSKGARKVYAVDVGYGQLHYRLRRDPRVIVLERTNARYLTKDLIPDPINVLTADVSFISLRKILPPSNAFLCSTAWIFVLIKPQFEAPREDVGKGGVVRDPDVRDQCVQDICTFAEKTLAWRALGVVPSPIKGPKGNQEFVAVFRTVE